MIRLLKFMVALLLLPTLGLAFVEMGYLFVPVFGQGGAALSFLAGSAVYGLIHYTFYNFSRVYVLGHEMTHALAACLCGYRVHKISVQKESGYVKMDKTNTFVVLAPYFVPFYVLVLALVYWIGGYFFPLRAYNNYMLFAVGFALTFHLIQTFHTLWEADQPDLKLAGGKVFSLVMIGLVNVAVLAGVLKILFPQKVHLAAAGLHVLRGTVNCWRIIVNYIIEQIINAV